MAFTNRYAGKCGGCGGQVAAGAGLCKRVAGKFTAFHKSCEPSVVRTASMVFIETSGGSFYQNAKGRCEDAPCCGCCNC